MSVSAAQPGVVQVRDENGKKALRLDGVMVKMPNLRVYLLTVVRR